MKLAIPTLNRPEAISTPFLDVFEGFDIYIIFHTELDKKKYEAVHDLSNFKLIVTGIEPVSDGTGKAKQIEYFLDNYVNDNEWIIFADDDVYSVEGLVNNDEFKKDKLTSISKDWFDYYDEKIFSDRVLELIGKANSINAHMVGFQVSRNWFYAKNKYRYRGYVMGGLYMWKKDKNFVIDYPYVAMEDMHFSAMQVVHYGCVLLCDYFWANCGYFNNGGLGTKSERKNNHLYAMKYLSKKYVGLLKPKIKKDKYPDLRFSTMNEATFKTWWSKYKEFRNNYTFNDETMNWVKD